MKNTHLILLLYTITVSAYLVAKWLNQLFLATFCALIPVIILVIIRWKMFGVFILDGFYHLLRMLSGKRHRLTNKENRFQGTSVFELVEVLIIVSMTWLIDDQVIITAIWVSISIKVLGILFLNRLNYQK